MSETWAQIFEKAYEEKSWGNAPKDDPQPEFRRHRMANRREYCFVDIGSDYRLHMWTEDERDTLSRFTGRAEALCLELELRWGDLHIERKITVFEMAHAMKSSQFGLQRLIDYHLNYMHHSLMTAQHKESRMLEKVWHQSPISQIMSDIKLNLDKGYV